MSLQDKVAIVTGAASGIGKEIAREFFANGAKVAIADLNIDAAKATASELDGSGARAIGVAMNVTEEDEVDRLLVEEHERLFARTSGEGAVALFPEEKAENVLEDLLVVDDEDVHGLSNAGAGAGAAGSSTVNRQPRGSRFSNASRPPCCSTIE